LFLQDSGGVHLPLGMVAYSAAEYGQRLLGDLYLGLHVGAHAVGVEDGGQSCTGIACSSGLVACYAGYATGAGAAGAAPSAGDAGAGREAAAAAAVRVGHGWGVAQGDVAYYKFNSCLSSRYLDYRHF
jgi:hypothetical protein